MKENGEDSGAWSLRSKRTTCQCYQENPDGYPTESNVDDARCTYTVPEEDSSTNPGHHSSCECTQCTDATMYMELQSQIQNNKKKKHFNFDIEGREITNNKKDTLGQSREFILPIL